MKFMRRLTSLLLALLILFSIAGCTFADPQRGIDTTAWDSSIETVVPKSREETTASEWEETTAEEETTAAQTTAPETTSRKTEKVTTAAKKEETAKKKIHKNGTYTSKEDVALYIHTYGKLPNNFITKKEAEKLGWTGGSLDRYAKGKCIGGSFFGNYEGLLPTKKGRRYTECDIDTLGKKSRGAKRIIFSNDGLVYYTDDHYETFELLYGEE